ncbi:MAG TPA: FAD:protein FMN transferase [Terriglobales bacterium]|nr:FAD:protein FMN transferase [Terriglobales bacterium]
MSSRVMAAAGLLALTLHAMAAEKASPVKQIRYRMGTLCEITAYPVDGDGRRTDAAIEAAFAEVTRLDHALSNWKPDSELMRLNTAAAAEGRDRPWAPAGEELFERLLVALRIAEATDGRFDPTVGPLVRAYGFLPRGNGGDTHVREASRRVGWRKVRLDVQGRRVQFAESGMEVDLGGIAKGYAAQRAAEVLRQHGIRAALVNLGGSSIVAVGSPARGTGECDDDCRDGWPVLVRDPRDGRTPVAFIELRDGEALGTSGTYEKLQGRRSHILDPRTGRALEGKRSATVLLRNAEVADALAKPFLLLGALEGSGPVQLCQSYPAASVMLLAARGGALTRWSAGPEAERFLLISVSHEKPDQRTAQAR